MDRNSWSGEFTARFKKHEAELRQLYAGLYRNDENAWDYFVNMMAAACRERQGYWSSGRA